MMRRGGGGRGIEELLQVILPPCPLRLQALAPLHHYPPFTTIRGLGSKVGHFSRGWGYNTLEIVGRVMTL